MRGERDRLSLVIGFLVLVHFGLRPRLGMVHGSPDFLALALLIYAIRRRPGAAAVAGFVLGFLGDALVPARFGAGALAHTVVGYLAAWGRAVFFPDNLLVNGAAIGLGVWLRNAIVLLASGGAGQQIGLELFVWAPFQALSTALAGMIVLVAFRDWLDIRLER